MNLHRGICALSLAICVAATSGVCFGQAAPKKKDIYSATADAHAEIREALDKAATTRYLVRRLSVGCVSGQG